MNKSQGPANSKFLHAFKKKEKKVINVVRSIKQTLKEEKMRELEFAGRDDWEDYGDGYRQTRPSGFENKECWMTDPSEDERAA